MPILADWPITHAAAEFDVIELPILLPEWQLNALETAARDRGMTIGQLIRRLLSDHFADKRPPRD